MGYQLMRINKITTKYTPVSFGSNMLENIPAKPVKVTVNNNSSYIDTGLLGLALIGTAALAVSLLKNKNTTTAKVVQGTVQQVVQQKPQTTDDKIILQRLHGKRDFNAKMLYKAFKAKDKRASLLYKYFNGDFSESLMPYIKANNEYLQRMESRVL